MSTTTKLTKDDTSENADQKMFNMIDSLFYLCARPDISFSVHACSRFQANTRLNHLVVVKCVIQYVSVTLNYAIWYSRDTNCQISGFTDANWAGKIDTCKSTYGGCLYVGNNLTNWSCKT